MLTSTGTCKSIRPVERTRKGRVEFLKVDGHDGRCSSS